MNKQEKAQEIEALRSELQSRPPTFVLAYRGLTVNQVSVLRKKVRAASSSYRVVKNRLALRVIKGTPYEGLAPHFEGPTAIAYSSKDPSALAKALEEFIRENQGARSLVRALDQIARKKQTTEGEAPAPVTTQAS